MITSAIFDWARRIPEKTAIVVNGRVWSYARFAGLIAIARGYFGRRGYAGPGVAVLATPKLIEFWVLSLALRSLGLTTMSAPTIAAIGEPGLPDIRLVVASAPPPWPELRDACAALGAPLELVSLDGEAPVGLDGAPPVAEGGHILRTSGTTGAAKKVLMDPAFEAAFMRERREILGIGHNAVVAVFEFSSSTGVGYNSPVAAWFAGATVVIGQDQPTHLGLAQPGVTHAMVIPLVLARILSAPSESLPRHDAMHLSVTSGTITQAEIDEVRRRLTTHIFNRVGSTEVNTFANTRLDSPDDHRWHRLVPGRTVEIVDELDRVVPTGQLGRVRVSTRDGPTGYVHDDEATKTFFKDGFFYPGDLGLMRADGRMALQGRATDVINIRGVKVLPDPVEFRLREALGVSDACLLSMQDEAGEEELHLALETGAPIKTDVLTEALRRELYGFPGVHVHYVPTFPRNDRGKVMRLSLAAGVIAKRAASRGR